MGNETRRRFLKTSAGAVFAATLVGSVGETLTAATRSPAALPIKKGILLSMLPANLNYGERLALAHEIGFEVLQALTEPDQGKAEELKKAADAARIRIDSVMNMDHWKYPLSSSDPAAVEKSLAGMRTSLHNAKLWGSDVVLLVPARSQKEIRKLLPLAEELKVVIAIEEVWNRFLLSPLEMAKYIDEFQNPWVKAWFDVGNVVLYGYPQDWIRTLDKRIVKVHLKDFKRNKDSYAWVNLGDGDVDWAAVREAFAAIHYTGSATVELEAGDEAYLRDVSRRVDRLLLNRS